jgi:hypothetical protein
MSGTESLNVLKNLSDYDSYLEEVELLKLDEIKARVSDGATPLTITNLKNFHEWYYKGSQSQITKNGKATITTMDNHITHFSMGLYRKIGSKISEEDKEEVLEHLREIGAEDVKKGKGSADSGVMKNIIIHHYKRGKAFWTPSGFSLAFKLLYYTGARTGSILVDSVYDDCTCYEVRKFS